MPGVRTGLPPGAPTPPLSPPGSTSGSGWRPPRQTRCERRARRGAASVPLCGGVQRGAQRGRLSADPAAVARSAVCPSVPSSPHRSPPLRAAPAPPAPPPPPSPSSRARVRTPPVIAADCTDGPEPAGPRGNKERSRVRSAPAVPAGTRSAELCPPPGPGRALSVEPTDPAARTAVAGLLYWSRRGAGRLGSRRAAGADTAQRAALPGCAHSPDGSRAGLGPGAAVGWGHRGEQERGKGSGQARTGLAAPAVRVTVPGDGWPQRWAGGGLRCGALQSGGQRGVTAGARGTAVPRSARGSGAVQERRGGFAGSHSSCGPAAPPGPWVQSWDSRLDFGGGGGGGDFSPLLPSASDGSACRQTDGHGRTATRAGQWGRAVPFPRWQHRCPPGRSRTPRG